MTRDGAPNRGGGPDRASRCDTPVGDNDELAAAFERWVLPELATMYRVARAITHDHAEAEDLVQDSLLRAYRALGRFDGANPRAWLLTIVRNTNLNRRRRRRPGLLADPGSIEQRAIPAPGADADALAQVFDTRVEAALRALPKDQQAVIELVDMGGLSYEQAAQALAIPIGTVMSRLHRGRRRIKRKLSGTEVPGLEEGLAIGL